MRIILFSITCFLTSFSFAQNELATIQDIYKNRVIVPDEVVALANEKSEEFGFFLFQGKTINGYQFDKSHNIIQSLKIEDKQRKYKQIFGKTILDNGDFVMYLSNNKRRKFASTRFSFAEQTTEFYELDLDLENEKILQTADFNNKFHVLTITQNTSTINVYRFEDANSYEKFPIDFNNSIFSDAKQKDTDLYRMLTENSGMYGLNKSVDLVKIASDTPTSLEIGCNLTKFYVQNDKVIFSFDENEDFTQLLEISLSDMKGEVWRVKKALENWSYKEKNTNSFFHENILYQIVVSKRIVHLRAQDYKTGEIINEQVASDTEKILFKNSPIIQTGGTFDSHREFEDTNTLLRKVMRGKAGISVYKFNDSYEVTFGGIIERDVNPGMMMPGFGIPIASLGAVTVFFNPTFFAYQSYTHTKALKVDGLFNANFEHQNGSFSENIFQRIESFEIENKIAPAGRTIFRLNNSYILGNYDAYNKTYTLRRF